MEKHCKNAFPLNMKKWVNKCKENHAILDDLLCSKFLIIIREVNKVTKVMRQRCKHDFLYIHDYYNKLCSYYISYLIVKNNTNINLRKLRELIDVQTIAHL